MPVKLIVGLANPGSQYEKTRHNAGEWWLKELCYRENVDLKLQAKLQAKCGKLRLSGNEIHIAVPTTYMNLSGQAVQKLLSYYKIEPKDLLIIHDELDLNVGTIRYKFGGGHAGHNGLRNIIDIIKTRDFGRLRIGIGRPQIMDVADYVLAPPSQQEKNLIDEQIATTLDQINDIITKET